MFLCGKIRQKKRKGAERQHLAHCLQSNRSLEAWTTEPATDRARGLETRAVTKRRRLDKAPTPRAQRPTLSEETEVGRSSTPPDNEWLRRRKDNENSLPSRLRGNGGKDNAECSGSPSTSRSSAFAEDDARDGLRGATGAKPPEDVIYDKIAARPSPPAAASGYDPSSAAPRSAGDRSARPAPRCRRRPTAATPAQRASHGKLKLTLLVPDPSQLVIQAHKIIYDEKEVPSRILCLQTLLIPDDSQKTLQEVQSVNTRHQHFEDELVYDLTGVDVNKRLWVGVRCAEGKNRNMVGCMSFGIKHLLSKSKKHKTPIDDWYHLLPEHLGNHKHILCNHGDRLATDTETSDSDEKENVKPNVNKGLEKKLCGTENYTVIVTKLRGGFGFTIKGLTPVRVGRVKPGGAAEGAGLHSGDYILEINGRDTTFLSLDRVANVVRNARDRLQMSVARRKQGEKTADGERRNAVNPVTINWMASPSQDAPSKGKNPFLWQPQLSVIREERPAGRGGSGAAGGRRSDDGGGGGGAQSSALWQPDLSDIAPLRDATGRRIGRAPDQIRNRTYEEIGGWDSMVADSASSCQPESFTDTELTEGSRLTTTTTPTTTPHHNSYDSLVYRSAGYPTSQSSDESVASDGSCGDGGALRRQPAAAVGRQVAVRRLLAIEEDFARIMKRGTQRYSRPLRHQLLSRKQHLTLFQNIEKLIMLSEFHICQMIERNYSAEDSYTSLTDGAVVDRVGDVYKGKISVICGAYKMYADGVGDALRLLDELKDNDRFLEFLSDVNEENGYGLGLDDFIRQPLRHFQQLVSCLDQVLESTPDQHPDHRNIERVMEVIYHAVNDKFKPSQPSISCHDSSSGYYTNVTSAGRRRCCSGSSSPSSNSTDVDAEIADLQHRISFAGHVRPFVVATSRRHVILSGALLCRRQGAPPTTCWAVLCNDTLLLTEKDARGQLKVTEEPVALHQILQADFDTVHPAEFHIVCQRSADGGRSADWRVEEYQFRASNVEEKYAWKAVLEQRIKYTKSKTDSAYVSMEEVL